MAKNKQLDSEVLMKRPDGNMAVVQLWRVPELEKKGFKLQKKKKKGAK